MTEVLREHFGECFQHFFEMFQTKFPRGVRERRRALEPLANFCYVSADTVAEWEGNNSRLPSGETLIKMMFWLDLHGYKIIELERMDKTVRGFAELVGFGLMTAKQASELVGYKNPQNFYDVVRGKSGLSEEKKLKMWDAWKVHKERLEETKKNLLESSSLRTIFEQPTLGSVSTSQNIRAQRKAIMQITSGLLTFFEGGLFTNLSEEEAGEFRNDLQNVVDLCAHLNGLSSRLKGE